MIGRKKWDAAVLRKIEGSIFIAPWLFGFLAFVAFPLGYSIYMSFNRVELNAKGININPVGLQYYREILLADGGLLYDDLFPFLRQALVMIPIILVFSLLIGILLNLNFYGRAFFRVIFFLPVIFTSGLIVQEFLVQGEGALSAVSGGAVDSFVRDYLPASWGSPIKNVVSSFVLVLWYSGVQILIFLAGRQTIPHTIYEAARIDGSDPWNTFWKITLPGLSPFIFLNLIYTIVDLFTFPSNPIINKVNTVNYGLSSALAWIYFIIVLALIGAVILTYSAMNRSLNGKR